MAIALFCLLGILTGLVFGFWIGRRSGSDHSETAAALARLQEMERQTERLRLERDGALSQASEISRKLGALESIRDSYQKQFENQGRDLEAMRDKILKEVEMAAHKALEQNSNQFQERAEKGVNAAIDPLKEKIKDFEKKVDERYADEKGQVYNLREEIKRISSGADVLVQALRGEQKTQGDWGEMQVESLFEASGLRENEDFVAQAEGLGLKDENGRVQRPDYLIKLPEGKHIILDSKVSLKSWFDYCAAETEAAKKDEIGKTLDSIRAHVDELSAKHYAAQKALKSPDFVLMFLSPEGALLAALKRDPGLFEYAWSRGVMIVGPSTTLPALKTVAHLWRGERQTKNAIEIARQAAALYDEFVSVLSALQELEKALARAEEKREEVVKRLSQGRGNVIKRIEDLKKLGVKAAKKIPDQFLEENTLELSGPMDVPSSVDSD